MRNFLRADLDESIEPDQFVDVVRKGFNRGFSRVTIIASLIGLAGWLATGSLDFYLAELLWVLGWIGHHLWFFGFRSKPDPKRVAKRLGKWLERTFGKWDAVKRPEWVNRADRIIMRIESGKTQQSKLEPTQTPKHE